MNPEIEALAAYILENKAELDYYSNENGYEFTARNVKLFESYKVTMTYQDWVNASELVLAQLPEKIRQRGLTNREKVVKLNMERQTSEEFHFTVIHEKDYNNHQLIIQPVDGGENEKVTLKIHGAAWESMKEMFGTRQDPVSGQTQVFKKE